MFTIKSSIMCILCCVCVCVCVSGSDIGTHTYHEKTTSEIEESDLDSSRREWAQGMSTSDQKLLIMFNNNVMSTFTIAGFPVSA